MKRIRLAVMLTSALSLSGGVAFAQGVPQRLSFTGNLTNSGAPETGTHNFIFRLFDAPTNGTQAWTETQNNLTITNGMVYATLGVNTPLTPTIFNGATLYLEVQIDSTTLAPRSQVTSVPYAIRAGVANSAETLGALTPGQVQQRIASTCTGANAIQTIDPTGNVTCVSTAGGTGDITSVIAGAGLQGGAATGDATLALVTCAMGQVLKSTGAGWGCASDNDSTTTASAPLSAAGNNISLTTCLAGQIYKMVGTSWACTADNDTQYSAGSGLTLAGTTFATDNSVVARKDSLAGNQAFDSTTLVLDYANNRVGIGTSTPAVSLDVAGPIRGNSLQLTVAQTGYYNQPGHAFTPDNVGAGWNIGAGYGNLTSGTSIGLGAPVTVPDGVTITQLDCYRYDNDAANNVGGSMVLYRRAYTSTTNESLGSVSLSTAGQSTSVQVVTVAVAGANNVVDNDLYQYYLSGTFLNTPALGSLYFYGCRVRYTYTQIRF